MEPNVGFDSIHRLGDEFSTEKHAEKGDESIPFTPELKLGTEESSLTSV